MREFEEPFEDEREPERIVVSMVDRYKVVTAPDIGETTGLGPCFGIILNGRSDRI